MVRSLLNETINYHEIKELDRDDYDLNATIYEVEYLEVDVVIVVGNQKYTFIEKGIIYLPIYLVHKGELVEKIGVYEFLSSNLLNLLDEDDDIDISMLGEPLLFSYVSKEYLEKYTAKSGDEITKPEEHQEEEGVDEEEEGVEEESIGKEGQKSEEDSKEKAEEDNKDVTTDETSETESISREKSSISQEKSDESDVSSLESIQEKLKGDDVIPEEGTIIKELFMEEDPIVSIREETEVDNKKEIELYEKTKDESRKNWMQTYMKNNNYDIIDNEGGGDCLFAVIRDAFGSVGKKTSVAKLRKIIASQATQTQLDTLITIYNSFIAEHNQIEDSMKKLIVENNRLKQEVNYKPKGPADKPELTREEKKKHIEQSKKNVSQYRALKKELAFSSSQLEEYAYLKGVKTLDDFRKIIQTCEYWGETWSISTLERLLNIKIIIMSSESYKAKDYENVLQCGQLNDTILEEKGVFKPKYYIMTDWMGWHYKTISYKGKKALTYEELPYAIKTKIFDKCLERMSGPYSLIPKFIRGKELYEASIVQETGETSEELEEEEEIEEDTPATERLYNDDTIFQIYHRSANRPPGKGIGEVIPVSKQKSFAALQSYENWRRKLSNNYETPFVLDGHTWNSVTHYVTAQYFKTHSDYYKDFSLSSTSELGKMLSKNAEIALSTLKSSGIHKSQRIRPSEIKPSKVLNSHEVSMHMMRALEAKFTQHEESREILDATKDAKIMLFIPRKPAKPFMNLMKLRKQLKEQKKSKDL